MNYLLGFVNEQLSVKECLDWLMKFAFVNPKITKEELLNKIKQFKK